jgi:hypothetical protein
MLYYVVNYPVFKTAKVVIFSNKERWGNFFISEWNIHHLLGPEEGFVKPGADRNHFSLFS